MHGNTLGSRMDCDHQHEIRCLIDALSGQFDARFGMLFREENMSVQPIIGIFLQALLAILLGLPAAVQQTAPSIPSSGFPGLDEYRASRVAIYTDDFGQLARYRDADAALGTPAAGESRVVFLGDSITDYWKLPTYFPGKPYINRGIDGQSTPEMLVRFRQDVIDVHPKVLVVLAGTNDIAGVTGRTRNEDIEANYASMAELR